MYQSLPATLLLILLAVPMTAAAADETALPVGTAPPAVEEPHFPSRMHALVWRNWNLVPVERVAHTIGAAPEEVRRVAASMGLPAEQAVPPGYAKRLYLTVIRRNWHLLPYDQLLVLLDWTPRRLAEALREDDFLFVKLGGLKPRCDPIRYAEPTDAQARRAAEIKGLVEREFGPLMNGPSEPRLAFVDRLSSHVDDPRPVPPSSAVRYLYSYFAVFGDPLSDPALDPYPDALLQRYADLGVNGVWLHVVLRQLVPSADFPEFGEGAATRLENLRKLVARAKRFGINVYLYMNEPRAMPAAFFEKRQGLAGVREGDHVAMCTSAPQVRRWLADSLAHVFTEVPDLGGVFTITASENLTNCASHFQQAGCPRCKDRPAAEIIAEVNTAIAEGVHRSSKTARVICWDWGWQDGWARDVIARLPKDVALQSVSEWSLPIRRGGVSVTVGEYSISAVGPGPRATAQWAAAKAAGLSRVAKVQLNNSWELSAVPYLPVMDLVARHCERLAAADVNGMMLGWSLGGYPSPNLEIARRFQERPAPTAEQVLDDLAKQRFGPAGAAHARKAWTAFSAAFEQYPYDGGVVYNCPVQLGPANLLRARPTGYTATMVGFPYDNLDGWRGPYPREVFAGQFEKMAAKWASGLPELAAAADAAPPEHADEARAELRFARAAHLHFKSVAQQARFVMAREALSKATTDADQSGPRAELRKLLAAESADARELCALARQESRIGFEASNHYYYVPQDLMEKVISCAHLAGPEGGLMK